MFSYYSLFNLVDGWQDWLLTMEWLELHQRAYDMPVLLYLAELHSYLFDFPCGTYQILSVSIHAAAAIKLNPSQPHITPSALLVVVEVVENGWASDIRYNSNNLLSLSQAVYHTLHPVLE